MNTRKDVHKCDENLYFTYSRLGAIHKCDHLQRCRKVSIINSQSCIYVGFIHFETKKRGAGIGKGSPLFLRSLAVCVFRPAIPPRSHPCVALSASPDEVVAFPIPSAKVQQLSDICKFFGRKMQKYVAKHKKRDPERVPF